MKVTFCPPVIYHIYNYRCSLHDTIKNAYSSGTSWHFIWLIFPKSAQILSFLVINGKMMLVHLQNDDVRKNSRKFTTTKRDVKLKLHLTFDTQPTIYIKKIQMRCIYRHCVTSMTTDLRAFNYWLTIAWHGTVLMLSGCLPDCIVYMTRFLRLEILFENDTTNNCGIKSK